MFWFWIKTWIKKVEIYWFVFWQNSFCAMLLQHVPLEYGLANCSSIWKHLEFRITCKLSAVILFLSLVCWWAWMWICISVYVYKHNPINMYVSRKLAGNMLTYIPACYWVITWNIYSQYPYVVLMCCGFMLGVIRQETVYALWYR